MDPVAFHNSDRFYHLSFEADTMPLPIQRSGSHTFRTGEKERPFALLEEGQKRETDNDPFF
jgi:hypothetical protein